MNGVTAAEKAAILKHYTAQAQQRTGSPVTWLSATFGTWVNGWLDSDGEPSEPHHWLGSVGGAVWLDSVEIAGVELVEHLTKATLDVLAYEAVNSFRSRA